jgi:hypothetical protein
MERRALAILLELGAKQNKVFSDSVTNENDNCMFAHSGESHLNIKIRRIPLLR